MYPKAIVALQSTGGSLIAGIDIGTQIRLRNYTTLVPSGVLCASACAVAWLGGTNRLMGPGALIGFHAAYVDQSGQAIETGVGNALLGAYLNKLGLPDRAIIFITQAHPNSLTWLTIEDAAREGINVALFNTPAQTPNAAAGPTSSPTLPQQPSPISALEKRASIATTEFLDRLSQPVSLVTSYLTSIYADDIMYFGKVTSKQDVLRATIKYMERWPERSYSIIQDSINCNSDSLICSISGQLKWFARSAVRNIEAQGTADFLYKFSFSAGSPKLLLQNSHVLTRSSHSLQGAAGPPDIPAEAGAQTPLAWLPPAVRAVVEESAKGCEAGKFSTERGFVTQKDVNGDGVNDFIIDYGKLSCSDGSHFCGTAGCLTQVFVSLNGNYVKVLDENVRDLHFGRIHGRAAMQVDLHGIACGRAGAEPCEVTLYWNGSMFSPAD
jgi:hypothetical protein